MVIFPIEERFAKRAAKAGLTPAQLKSLLTQVAFQQLEERRGYKSPLQK
jgi:hypothetical protein